MDVEMSMQLKPHGRARHLGSRSYPEITGFVAFHEYFSQREIPSSEPACQTEKIYQLEPEVRWAGIVLGADEGGAFEFFMWVR